MDRARLWIGLVGFASIGAILGLVPAVLITHSAWPMVLGASLGAWFAWATRND